MYWSLGGSVSVTMPVPSSDEQSSMKIRVAAPCGALTGIWSSIRPLLPQSWMRWCGAICVETVKSRRRPSPKSISALVRRSVRNVGSRSTSAMPRVGSAPRKKRPATMA